MFFIKKVIFKFMELGLGLRTCFSLETKDPIFVNFKLSPDEIEKVKAVLPDGFKLLPIRFTHLDETPHYWVSYNFYELRYPKPELSAIKKSRLEINTFVEDSLGRKGIFVFCESPFVSKESKKSLIGLICDFAEWLVTQIYGCGKLVPLQYLLSDRLKVAFSTLTHQVEIDLPTSDSREAEIVKLSSDYCLFNDISFFNQGKTFDYVNVNSSFYKAEFFSVSLTEGNVLCEGPFFKRKPDHILAHRGEISYLVNSMNRGLIKGLSHV